MPWYYYPIPILWTNCFLSNNFFCAHKGYLCLYFSKKWLYSNNKSKFELWIFTISIWQFYVFQVKHHVSSSFMFLNILSGGIFRFHVSNVYCKLKYQNLVSNSSPTMKVRRARFEKCLRMSSYKITKTYLNSRIK